MTCLLIVYSYFIGDGSGFGFGLADQTLMHHLCSVNTHSIKISCNGNSNRVSFYICAGIKPTTSLLRCDGANHCITIPPSWLLHRAKKAAIISTAEQHKRKTLRLTWKAGRRERGQPARLMKKQSSGSHHCHIHTQFTWIVKHRVLLKGWHVHKDHLCRVRGGRSQSMLLRKTWTSCWDLLAECK